MSCPGSRMPASPRWSSPRSDATMEGPDVEAYERLVQATSIPVVASGGVGTLDHLRDLNRLPLEGVIVGKAIYERRFTVEEALAALA